MCEHVRSVGFPSLVVSRTLLEGLGRLRKVLVSE